MSVQVCTIPLELLERNTRYQPAIFQEAFRYLDEDDKKTFTRKDHCHINLTHCYRRIFFGIIALAINNNRS